MKFGLGLIIGLLSVICIMVFVDQYVLVIQIMGLIGVVYLTIFWWKKRRLW